MGQAIFGGTLWILFILVCLGLVWLWRTDPQRVHDRTLKAKQKREAQRLRAKEFRS